MVIRECVWDVCVYISCTGDEGQLRSRIVPMQVMQAYGRVEVSF